MTEGWCKGQWAVATFEGCQVFGHMDLCVVVLGVYILVMIMASPSILTRTVVIVSKKAESAYHWLGLFSLGELLYAI